MRLQSRIPFHTVQLVHVVNGLGVCLYLLRASFPALNNLWKTYLAGIDEKMDEGKANLQQKSTVGMINYNLGRTAGTHMAPLPANASSLCHERGAGHQSLP